jgi:hypothetical protein
VGHRKYAIFYGNGLFSVVLGCRTFYFWRLVVAAEHRITFGGNVLTTKTTLFLSVFLVVTIKNYIAVESNTILFSTTCM